MCKGSKHLGLSYAFLVSTTPGKKERERACIPFVVLGRLNGLIDNLQHIRPHQVPFTKNPKARSVALHQIPVLTQLDQLDLCDLHKRVHFMQRPLKVFDRECVYGDDFYAGFVTDF